MKTIVINGLKFTDQPPTKVGWWLWKEHDDLNVPPIQLAIVKGRNNLLIAEHVNDVRCSIARLEGFWHELVPRQVFAKEVEKAFEEGWESARGQAYFESHWNISLAKRVAEGKE